MVLLTVSLGSWNGSLADEQSLAEAALLSSDKKLSQHLKWFWRKTPFFFFFSFFWIDKIFFCYKILWYNLARNILGIIAANLKFLTQWPPNFRPSDAHRLGALGPGPNLFSLYRKSKSIGRRPGKSARFRFPRPGDRSHHPTGRAAAACGRREPFPAVRCTPVAGTIAGSRFCCYSC